MQTPGYVLPLLLAQGFRTTIDRLHAQLAERGHADVRPVHGFALQALGVEGCGAVELARRLGVSKQAAAKTVDALEARGYVRRVPDPRDGRAKVVVATDRGHELLALSAEIFDGMRREWARELGEDRLAALERDLAVLGGADGALALGDLPGWLTRPGR